jgi:nicotinamide-nucleotide amidase
MFPDDIVALATEVLEAARRHGVTIAAAESCTAGLVAGALTAPPGSSDVFERGLVTYSNEAKAELLGVDPALIEREGAVSEGVARAMAEGVLARSWAALTVSVTGIAGPGGGSPTKPVGLVHFAVARTGHPTVHLERRFGELSRAGVRLASVRTALNLLLDALKT